LRDGFDRVADNETMWTKHLATARRLFKEAELSSQRPSERLRTPKPVLASRVASGRGAMEQPNNTDDVARLDVRFWWRCS
jgi:hypothetical protein